MALRFTAALIVGLWLIAAPRIAAHEIPADVTVHAFVRPEGQHLQLIVRVPLAAMRDMEFPTRPPGFLMLDRLGTLLDEAAHRWVISNVSVQEDGMDLFPARVAAARISLPSDRSFSSFDTALAHVRSAPLPVETELIWNQALLDLLLEYPISSDRSAFSIRPQFGRLGLRVATVLRFVPPGGAVRAFEYTGDPGLVHLDPRWHQSAFRFVALGCEHILSGVDHLLFLLCLVAPFRRLKPLVLIVTAFTVAHSITLIASALNFAPGALWFPPLIETLIATSIVYMALENIAVAAQGTLVLNLRRRWMLTFAFGLVHGFGFSFALRETLQFAGAHLLTSLVAFNVGVELGQLLALAILLPLLHVLFRHVVAERIGIIILSAIVAHQAWHWLTERGTALMAYQWPAADAALIARMLRWGFVLWIAVGAYWLWRVRRHKTSER